MIACASTSASYPPRSAQLQAVSGRFGHDQSSERADHAPRACTVPPPPSRCTLAPYPFPRPNIPFPLSRTPPRPSRHVEGTVCTCEHAGRSSEKSMQQAFASRYLVSGKHSTARLSTCLSLVERPAPCGSMHLPYGHHARVRARVHGRTRAVSRRRPE